MKSALLASVAFTVGAGATANAADETKVEKVTVTGSRLKQRDYTAISPVVTIGSQQLQQTQTLSVERLLNELPQIVPGNTVTSNNSGGEDFATIALRGLGPGRTLVLINGQRIAGSATDGVVDINTIPVGMIDRIEVVTGGTSAVYGSDAMAGVINFILKKNFEGVEVSATTGMAEHGYGQEVAFDGLMGASLDGHKGNVTIYGSYYQRDGVFQSAFDWSRTAAAIEGIADLSNNVKFTRIADSASKYLNNAQIAAIYGPGFKRVSALSGGSATPPWGVFTSTGANPFVLLSTRVLPGQANASGNFSADNHDCDPATPTVVTNGGALSFDDLGRLMPAHRGGTFGTPTPCRVPDRAAGSTRYNYAPVNHLVIPAERWNISAFGNYELDGTTTLSVGATYTDSKTSIQLAPTPIADSTLRVVLTPAMQALISTNHSDFWDALQSRKNPLGDVTVNNYRSADIGPRVGLNEDHTLNLFADVAGKFSGDWDWDVSGSYGRVNFDQQLQHNAGKTQLIQGLRGCQTNLGAPLPGALPGCIPLDIFGANQLTPAMQNFLNVNTTQTLTATQSRLTAYASGPLIELPAGSLESVFGLEYRYNSAIFTVDDASKNGDIYGFNAVQDQRGAIDVYEAFSEVSIPILKDLPFVHYLGAEAGYRMSDYSSVGYVHTYKYGGEYSPWEFLKFRGIYNLATRAPNVFELFQSGDQGFPGYLDPCATSNLATQAFCSTPGSINAGFVPAGQYPGFTPDNTQVQAFAFGTKSLRPETAKTLTLGAVVQTDKSWFPLGQFRGSVDYYDIRIDHAIAGRSATAVLASCYNNFGVGPQAAMDCAAINRDPVTGQVISVRTGKLNLAAPLINKGIDVQVDYSFELGDLWSGLPGKFSINELYSKLESYNFAGTQLRGTTSAGPGTAIPDWKSVLSMTYDLSDWSFFARWSYVPGMRQIDFDNFNGCDPAGTATHAPCPSGLNIPYDNPTPLTPPASYWDASIRWYVLPSTDITFGVNDIANSRPPQIAEGILGGQANTDPQVYRVLGRTFSLSVRSKF